MGKVKRGKPVRVDGDKVERSGPLASQILEDKSVKPSSRTKGRIRKDDDEEVCFSSDTYIIAQHNVVCVAIRQDINF